MLFNSFQFLIFFLIVILIYPWLTHRSQNRMLLIASLIFYGSWDWRFLILLLISASTDYWAALRISAAKNPQARKLWLMASLIVNLGILGFFKYFNFFAENLRLLLANAGLSADFVTLHIILPIGISFYTFQALSYTIDVYRREMKAVSDYGDFLLFITFFPQLVAGPIERAGNLLTQIEAPRSQTFKKFRAGAGLIFWGLFKKVVIADNAAKLANLAYLPGGNPSGLLALVGTYAFAIQIYCDFSGYSDTARGLARMLGFELMVNFRSPYLAAGPREFWRRWHISLSTWLRDYLYIPLGGNRKGEAQTYINLMITMFLGGLWHGARWTFVVWGLIHGLYLCAARFWEYELGKPGAEFLERPLMKSLRIAAMFHLTCFSWIFFRAETFGQAVLMLRRIFTDIHWPASAGSNPGAAFVLIAGILAAVLIYGWHHAQPEKPRWAFENLPGVTRWGFYISLAAIWLLTAPLKAQQFIYFQF